MATDAQIKSQVEFYFSESNMRKDTWLKAAIAEDAEGFIPISILTTFNRLAKLTTDETRIAACLKDSTEVVISEDGLRIRRAKALDPNDTSAPRTLYVKGFPLDDADVTIEKIQDQFSEYGKVLRVGLRKDITTKTFKGGAFIEFEEEASVKKACDAAHKPSEVEGGKPAVILSFKGKIFDCVMPYPEWLHNHTAKLERIKKVLADKKNGGSKKVAAKDEGAVGETSGDKRKRDESDKSEEVSKAMKVEFVPGLIIKVKNIPKESTLFNLKDSFKAVGNLKYVEYINGSGECFARFSDPENAKQVLANMPNNFSGELITGEEEISYWTKIVMSSTGGRGGKGDRGGKAGRGGFSSFRKAKGRGGFRPGRGGKR